MSWQEDLRQLDADLAAGRIEPAAHRKQRDELLAQASGSTVPSPVPSPLRRPATAWQSKNPAAQPEAAPAQRLDTPSNPPGYQPPIRPPVRQTPPVPPWQRTGINVPPVADHLTTAPSPADITPTRYLTVEGAVPDRPQVSRFPPPYPPGAAPAPPAPDEPGKHRSDEPGARRPTWLFLALGVLLVLAMIVGVTAWIGSGSDPAPEANAPSSASDSTRTPPLDDRVPQMPGKQNPNNSTMSVAKGLELGLYPASTADLLNANGATKVIYRGAADGDVSYLVLVVPTSSPGNAQTVVEKLYQDALTGGFRSVQSPLRTVSGRDGATFLNTTWYGSGSNVVSIGIAEPYRGQAGLSSELDKAVDALEAVLPVS
ncbi:hypothetical protein [Amycolatopsis australiensis]|uniref:Flagellar basal body-associated protein FliL n=1 Tax=Amycolatopsis australiensis TaxID=546364 RepID=A0A1K1PWZ2_9PSEU|nr:hypothetical protein [Amycolatopsis australiensis]SFW52037.1 hypothetical protein SAMN04489730_1117 [Amycolatopsis australiensis]